MWRVIDISGEGNYFHVRNRNVVIEKAGARLGTVAFADIHSIIVHGNGNSFSEEFLASCADNSIPVVFCDAKHMPSAMLLPWYQHSDSASKLANQISSSRPRQKQTWQRIVKAKICNQAKLLGYAGRHTEENKLFVMSRHVLSGDSTNLEAQAARLYFQSLFGENFIRHESCCFQNAFLDYGYTIIRSMIARAVVGAGLCPTVSIFHSCRTNPFALVDDLVEPLRPFVDERVLELISSHETENILSPANKRRLISLVTLPVKFGDNTFELSHAALLYVRSYYDFLIGETSEILYPQFKE